MFGKRIGFLKFKADIFYKETGKKVYDNIYVNSLSFCLFIILLTFAQYLSIASVNFTGLQKGGSFGIIACQNLNFPVWLNIESLARVSYLCLNVGLSMLT